VKNLRISSYIGNPFLIYDFAPDPILIYEENFVFFFISAPSPLCQMLNILYIYTSGGKIPLSKLYQFPDGERRGAGVRAANATDPPPPTQRLAAGAAT
jgi:hypothetical protein